MKLITVGELEAAWDSVEPFADWRKRARAIERIATQRALEAAAVTCWNKGMDDYLRVGWSADQREVGSMFAQAIRAMAKEVGV